MNCESTYLRCVFKSYTSSFIFLLSIIVFVYSKRQLSRENTFPYPRESGESMYETQRVQEDVKTVRWPEVGVRFPADLGMGEDEDDANDDK